MVVTDDFGDVALLMLLLLKEEDKFGIIKGNVTDLEWLLAVNENKDEGVVGVTGVIIGEGFFSSAVKSLLVWVMFKVMARLR